jgi:DNA invertase Pin-like site-specific DNA recombinase
MAAFAKARSSTKEQDNALQVDSIESELNKRGIITRSVDWVSVQVSGMRYVELDIDKLELQLEHLYNKQRREEFEQLKRMKKGDKFYVYDFSRLTRDFYDGISVLYYLLLKEITLITTYNGFEWDFRDPDHFELAVNKITNNMTEVIRIRRRTKAALQLKKKNGKAYGKVPYGYRRNYCCSNCHAMYLSLKKMDICKECKADLIDNGLVDYKLEQEIIGLIKTGLGVQMPIQRIISNLTGLGYKNRKGNPLSYTQVKRIISILEEGK